MQRALDLWTSQNSSIVGSPNASIVANVFELVGQIGLIVTDAVGIIRVDLWGSVGLTHDPGVPGGTPTITIRIVNGTSFSDRIVYEAQKTITITSDLFDIFTIQAADFNPVHPASGQLTYTMFISADVPGGFRTGPESFGGTAFSDYSFFTSSVPYEWEKKNK